MTTEKTATAGIPSPCLKNEDSREKTYAKNWRGEEEKKTVTQHDPGLCRGWCIKFATGLNIEISIIQKVYEWLSCHFPKMITLSGDHFGKISGWSQIYFLIYAFFSIYPSRKFYAPPSSQRRGGLGHKLSKQTCISWHLNED